MEEIRLEGTGEAENQDSPQKPSTEKSETSFHIPEPGEPNPHTPSNDHVSPGLNLPEIKSEE